MNLPKEYANLATELIKLTNTDKVNWGRGEETEFTLNRGGVNIEIYPYTNKDEEILHYYYFSFKKESIHDGFRVSNWDYGYDLLEELYKAASRNAQGVRKAIDDFLSGFED